MEPTLSGQMTLEQITEILLESAQAAGQICRAERANSTVSFKPVTETSVPLIAIASAVVTSADLIVQEAILEHLLDSGLEECTVHAEESTPSIKKFRPSGNAPTIFIDPIDGTLAYSIACHQWKETALDAGFPENILEQTIARINPRLYGVVLGASVPAGGIAAVCMLPELGIVYHALPGTAFRNGEPLHYEFNERGSRIAIGRRLLAPNGITAPLFQNAGIEVQWFNGSSPGTLWHLFEGNCAGYAGVKCGFDMQLASIVARSAGMLVSNRNGFDLITNLTGYVDSIIISSSPEEKDQISAILRQYE